MHSAERREKSTAICCRSRVCLFVFLSLLRGYPSSSGGHTAKSSRPSRLYVGSISYDVTEHQIRELFSIFGPIVELEVPMDPQTGRHKGFAFVEYRTAEEALRAIAETHGKSVWGRNLKVNRPGEPSGSSSSGGGFNQPAGGAGSSSVVSEALAAVQARLNPGAAMFMPPQGGLGNIALPGSTGSSGGPKPGRIYVGNLAYDLTAEHIRQVFSSFGPIRDVTLPLDRDNNNRPKGFVFVEFENEAHAADAMASMNGFELCGRKLRVNGATAQGSGASGGVLSAPASGASPFNASAVAHAQLAASLLQSAGVGANSALGSFGGGLETDGFLSTNAQRAALMDKLSRGAGAGELTTASLGLGLGSASAPLIDSPILLLKNLVGPGEVDSELEQEVRDEAGQFGSISAVVIHETASHVLIFVQFASNAECAKARASLDKRIFGGKLIRALAYPHAKFQAGIYVPDP